MLNHNLFFGYVSFEDFANSDHLASTQNFLKFLSELPQDKLIKMRGYEEQVISRLAHREAATFNNYDFMLTLLSKVSTQDKVAKVYAELAYEYHRIALGNFRAELTPVNEEYLDAIWFFPSTVLGECCFIDKKCSILDQALTGLCKYIHCIITYDSVSDYTPEETEWFKLIKSRNLEFFRNAEYHRYFPAALTTILDAIIFETPQKSFNETIIRDLQWMRQTRRLDMKILDVCDKYNMYSLKHVDIQYDIISIGMHPDKYSMNPVDIVCEIISNIPTEILDKPKLGMCILEILNAVKYTMCDINTTEYTWISKCMSLDVCNEAIQRERERRLSEEYNGPDSIDFDTLATESVTPVYTQPIDYLDRWSFDYISGDEMEIATESYDDDDETEIRRRNREKRDELHEKRRKQSEKIRNTNAKIYRGYKTYKDNEEKVDSQLTSITKSIGQKVVGLETDKIRDEVIEGKKLTVIGTLKKALGTVAIFSVNKMAGLIAVVTHFYLHDRVTNKERKKVCLELEAEIEIVNEKIEDARADGNRKAKYDLMRTKNNLEVALRKIKAKADSSHNSAVGEAKSLVRRNRNS